MAREKQFGDPRIQGDMQVTACQYWVKELRNIRLKQLQESVAKDDSITNAAFLLRYVPFYELYIGENANRLKMSTGFHDSLVYPESALDGWTLENVSISKRPSEEYGGDKTAEGVVIFRYRGLLSEDDEVVRLHVTLKYDDPGYGCSRVKSSYSYVKRI